MISKMRGLLTPSIKCEVDYEKASKDVCNMLMHWQNGEAAGKMAFVPDVKDHDDYYATLKFFSYATEEEQLIPGSAKDLEKMASTCTMI